MGHLRTATIGPATAERLKSYGLASDLLPESYRAEAIVAAFRGQDVAGRAVLLPRAQEARLVLPQELTAMGAFVRDVAAYKTEPASADCRALIARLEARSVDLITFTSSSTVKNFKALLPDGRFAELTARVAAACIGPVTAATARELGLDVRIEARTYTIPGLCDAILAYYGSGNKAGVR
jgi:uroporphyrinogen III methyltransferase/synthase